jgi:ABC-2 type transport system permease protein
MTALVRAELLRMRSTRATWGLLAAGLVLTLTGAALVLRDVGGVAAPAHGSTELRDMLLGTAGVGLFPVLLLGVLAVTGEFHHRTATWTFLVTPGRRRVLVAKAAACTLVAPLAAVLFLAAALATGIATGAVDATPDARLGRLVAGALLVYACAALLGVGVGALIRNQTVAVAVPLLWFGVLETLAEPYGLDWLLPWLPGGASAALSGARFAGALPTGAAFLVLVAYALALLAPGTRGMVRRDIT